MKCLFTKMETLGMMIQQPDLDLGTARGSFVSWVNIFREIKHSCLRFSSCLHN